MNKINETHLKRTAYVYIRQSTMQQVQNNKESQKVQYGLVKKAHELGWINVKTIDDLGVSATGKVKRHGFEQLLTAICQGEVGAIFAADASRLARNGREWHTLLELCAFVKTIIVDLEAVYDPNYSNDRLLLGMKGTLSEMEVSLFRQRSQEALRQKAMRGELFTKVAIGYFLTKNPANPLEMDPNKRIKEAIMLVFKKFREFRSVRQVLLWFRQETIELPTINYVDKEKITEWKIPVYNTILKFLKNPVYAGAYVYGRTTTEVKIIDGQKKVSQGKRVDRKNWSIFISNHHEGFIDWDEYEKNQEIISHNANMKGALVRGSIKKGCALLSGLLRCGHCGRKILVHYSNNRSIRYHCKGAIINHGTHACISFGGFRVEQTIEAQILEIISPLGIEAALRASNELEMKNNEVTQQKTRALEQSYYEADRMRRQFDAVEPENRLVVSELEKRWNDALEKASKLENEIKLLPKRFAMVSEDEQKTLMELGRNIKKIWFKKETSLVMKKAIIRTLLQEIIVKITDEKIILILHWYGGDHTQIEVEKAKSTHNRWVTSIETTKIIEFSARYLPDQKIALLLNLLGQKTAKGHNWNQARIRTFRNDHRISIYQAMEHQQRGELMLSEAAELLKMRTDSVMRMIKKGILPAKQICYGSPWVLLKKDVDSFCAKK
jgi:DNA invertase Pin-like site-specific DNA recombinase